MSRLFLPLTTNNRNLYINEDQLKQRTEELEFFIQGNSYMNDKNFAKNVLFYQELKANNTIEGYNDDVGLVRDIINKNIHIPDKEKVQRIKNLYKGYKYILQEKEINKITLRELYDILSKSLLCEEDINNMGEFYRNNPVYIHYSNYVSVEPDRGIEPEKVEKYMNELFEYINKINISNSSTAHFIKSQILHFQFVNIHPYYDINGRTARTVSMWYLLNNKIYPYIIFNRAISLNKPRYYKVIRDVKQYSNATYFLNYMLDNVQIELEKEYIIDIIKSSNKQLSIVDIQSIYYMLSMKRLLSVKDFADYYNHFNDRKKTIEVYNTMINPLLNKGIIKKKYDTNTYITSDLKNFVFELNDSKLDIDKEKIKKLKR